jgi:hypothetical protein
MTRNMMAALPYPRSPPASIDTVFPHSAATVPLPSPMQREHDNDRDTKSRWIVNISDITRIRLRRHIKKIYNMLTHVIEGYGTYYYNKHGKPLPQETVDKIMCLYQHRIERRCVEVGLTVEEEMEWDSDHANVDVDALSKSGEESEEHDSDDVRFYSDGDDNDNVDDIDLSSENPRNPFELSGDDEKTDDVLIGKRKRKGNHGEKAMQTSTYV